MKRNHLLVSQTAVVCLLLGLVLPLIAAPHGGVTPEAFLPFVRSRADVPIVFGPPHDGEGTYYDADGSGNCSFPPSPDDLMVAAMNHTDYDNAALCGAYVEVTGPQGSVIVRIVDRCPECLEGDIDMSPQAFAQISDLAQGRVTITWRLVSYPLEGPIVYHFKEGSNQWWTAVQIRNHRNPVTQLEYWNGSQWVEAPRQEWNYFVAANGMGPGPYTFRVTDYFGHTLMDEGIQHIEDGEVPGGSQLPPPP